MMSIPEKKAAPRIAFGVLVETGLIAPGTMLTDAKHKTFDLYDVVKKIASLGQRPALFVIDREGVVRYNQVGTQQTNIPPIAEVLAQLDALG